MGVFRRGRESRPGPVVSAFTAGSVFGWIKSVTGFRQFSLRGIEKVTGEWDLVCSVTNLCRMPCWLQWA